MSIYFMRLVRRTNLPNNHTYQLTRSYAREPFPSKVAHYFYRAKLIDSIRFSIRSNPSTSLAIHLSDRLLDSFVVTHAFRSAPSADSALFINETLEKLPHFMHTQSTVYALAIILAKFRRKMELKSLIHAINAGRFHNVNVSFMNLMQWYAMAEDLESVLQVWDEYRMSDKCVCTESYNVVMRLHVRMGNDSEAVKIFLRMNDEGKIPNCRTYTIILEHLVKSGKISLALEIFHMLPLMRIKRTLKQYSVMVKGLIGSKRFEELRTLLNDMYVDGILLGRDMCLSLQHMQDAGFINETYEYLKDILPNKRIQNIECLVDDSDEDHDDDEDVSRASGDATVIQLKPWLDPRALANALNHWSPTEVSVLEDANIVWTTRLVCRTLRNFNSPEAAWEFFCWVAHQPGFTHDIYTVQRMIAYLARRGCDYLVDNLISKVRSEGMRLPFSTIKLIIDSYGFSNNADAALKVFHTDRTLCGPISKLNLMLLYSSLLRTLTKCRRNAEALNVLEEMILCGVAPDVQTFSGLMHYFASQGDIKAVQRLFLMVKQSGMEPDAYMFKVLIQAYCNCERAALALRIFEDMRNSNLMLDIPTKELLVRSLWKEGKRREAAIVAGICEDAQYGLPLMLRGDIWTVSSANLARVGEIYSNSFISSN